MQQLTNATKGASSPEECAGDIITGIPAVFRFMVDQARRDRHCDLTLPQLRVLGFVFHYDKASLSDAAEYLGVSAPAASRIVDLLVKRELLKRRVDAKDRRRISLSLTARGRQALEVARQATQAALAQHIRSLSRQDLAQISAAMRVLGRVFAPKGGPASSDE
ncbi:MAG: MarR family transcriptional regulator [Phycisphaerae bacterium]|nr:MarR family transcriptional regulator [Phycisphaerae bacterium]